MNIYLQAIRATIKAFPAVVSHLTGRARWVAFAYIRSGLETVKTYDYYLRQIERLVRGVYEGNIAGEFIDVMANLISGQITQAFEQAAADEGIEGDLPDYLTSAAEDIILGEFDHVDEYYRNIQDARIDETPIEPLLSRAQLWANRWNEAYSKALLLIRVEEGGNLEWVYGDDVTEHCPECASLNGVVARASEWQELDVHPQGAPNDKISCGGWRCGCTLLPTDKRRSPKAFDTIMNIVSR